MNLISNICQIYVSVSTFEIFTLNSSVKVAVYSNQLITQYCRSIVIISMNSLQQDKSTLQYI